MLGVEKESQAQQYLFFAMGDAAFGEWTDEAHRQGFIARVKEWYDHAARNGGTFPDGSRIPSGMPQPTLARVAPAPPSTMKPTVTINGRPCTGWDDAEKAVTLKMPTPVILDPPEPFHFGGAMYVAHIVTTSKAFIVTFLPDVFSPEWPPPSGVIPMDFLTLPLKKESESAGRFKIGDHVNVIIKKDPTADTPKDIVATRDEIIPDRWSVS